MGTIYGYSIVNFEKGDKYEGGWLLGNHYGKGTYYFSDGNKYKGDFI